MNMMKNANNTTKTKLLTLLCKELKDSNESIAITNHYLLSSQSPPSLLFFFWTTLELCRLPQVLFCTAWWETMEGGWKLQLASGRREKETRGKEWKGQRECDKSAPPIAPGKRRYKWKVLKASGQKVMPLLCGLFHLKSGLRTPHPPIFLLELFPSGGIFLVWFRKSTFNLLSFIIC